MGVREKGGKGRIEGRVADPERFDADPDSTFQAPPQLEVEGLERGEVGEKGG